MRTKTPRSEWRKKTYGNTACEQCIPSKIRLQDRSEKTKMNNLVPPLPSVPANGRPAERRNREKSGGTRFCSVRRGSGVGKKKKPENTVPERTGIYILDKVPLLKCMLGMALLLTTAEHSPPRRTGRGSGRDKFRAGREPEKKANFWGFVFVFFFFFLPRRRNARNQFHRKKTHKSTRAVLYFNRLQPPRRDRGGSTRRRNRIENRYLLLLKKFKKVVFVGAKTRTRSFELCRTSNSYVRFMLNANLCSENFDPVKRRRTCVRYHCITLLKASTFMC